jgi:hypothetical protein
MVHALLTATYLIGVFFQTAAEAAIAVHISEFAELLRRATVLPLFAHPCRRFGNATSSLALWTVSCMIGKNGVRALSLVMPERALEYRPDFVMLQLLLLLVVYRVV